MLELPLFVAVGKAACRQHEAFGGDNELGSANAFLRIEALEQARFGSLAPVMILYRG